MRKTDAMPTPMPALAPVERLRWFTTGTGEVGAMRTRRGVDVRSVLVPAALVIVRVFGA